MLRTAVRADGCLPLGEAASRLGFVPGALVDVIVTSAGTLILAINTDPPIEVPFRRALIRPERVALCGQAGRAS